MTPEREKHLIKAVATVESLDEFYAFRDVVKVEMDGRAIGPDLVWAFTEAERRLKKMERIR
jgi:hypothetical protein